MIAPALIAIWMLGVAVIAVAERQNLANNPDLWVGSQLLPVLILGWPVSLSYYALKALVLDREPG